MTRMTATMTTLQLVRLPSRKKPVIITLLLLLHLLLLLPPRRWLTTSCTSPSCKCLTSCAWYRKTCQSLTQSIPTDTSYITGLTYASWCVINESLSNDLLLFPQSRFFCLLKVNFCLVHAIQLRYYAVTTVHDLKAWGKFVPLLENVIFRSISAAL